MYKVLLVEDDQTLSLLMEKMKVWHDHDFQIEAKASHGKEALRKLEEETFDLVVTDISMPVMDGVELLQTIREKNILIPVIFVSAYSDFEYAQKGIVHGLFDYLLKPVDQEKLGASLERLRKMLDEEAEEKIDPVVLELLEEMGLDEKEDDFVRRIAAYCSAHYKEELSGDVFAENHGYNKNYFGTVFKQHFAMSHREFVNRLKIAFAIKLIKTGIYKAYEVSEQLGFSSYKYFSEKFKEVTGVAPTDYKFGAGDNEK